MGIWEALFGKKKIQEVSNEADAGFNSEFEVNQKNLKKIEAEEAAAETAAAKAAEENAPAAEETAEPADVKKQKLQLKKLMLQLKRQKLQLKRHRLRQLLRKRKPLHTMMWFLRRQKKQQ